MNDAPAAGKTSTPLSLDLEWQGDLRFRGTTGAVSLVLDSAGGAGPTPAPTPAFSLAACIPTYVVALLKEDRPKPRSLTAPLRAGRPPEHPEQRVCARP